MYYVFDYDVTTQRVTSWLGTVSQIPEISGGNTNLIDEVIKLPTFLVLGRSFPAKVLYINHQPICAWIDQRDLA